MWKKKHFFHYYRKGKRKAGFVRIDLVTGNFRVVICLLFSLTSKQNHQWGRSQTWKLVFPGGGLKEPLHKMREKAGQGKCQAALTSVYDN